MQHFVDLNTAQVYLDLPDLSVANYAKDVDQGRSNFCIIFMRLCTLESKQMLTMRLSNSSKTILLPRDNPPGGNS